MVSLLGIAAALVLPLSNFVGHAHWNKVVWIPFHEVRPSGLDLLQNVMLFFPLGFFQILAAVRPRAGNIVRVAALGAAISFTGEFYQIFCHERTPSATDVLTNTVGTALGAACAQIARVAWEGEKHV